MSNKPEPEPEPETVKTEDGYTFHRLPTGEYTDGDLTYENFKALSWYISEWKAEAEQVADFRERTGS
jgi:hypothetical protein